MVVTAFNGLQSEAALYLLCKPPRDWPLEYNQFSSYIFPMMKRLHESGAAASFDALGHEVRLRIFRLLVRAGEDGANVGHIGQALDLPASTLAHHLHTLVNAGLVHQERQGREIINRADFAAVDALTTYLTEECCMDAGRRRESAA